MISLEEQPTTLLAVIGPRAGRGHTRDKGNLSRSALIAWALLVLGLALWLYSLRHADLSRIDGYGLLPALPLAWYAALAVLLVTAVTVALTNAVRTVLLAACVVAIILVVHATPALLYDLPRYTWTFKHIGVTNVILAQRAAPRAADIYFDWPGFFTAAGWISQSTGISLTQLATWSPPFFNLAFAAAVSFVARGLTKDLRIVWLTTLLFVITNWVGQDYFAPQAYAFMATLVLTGLLMRTTPMARTAGRSLLGVGRLRRLITGRRDDDIASIYGVFSELDIGTATRTTVAAVLWLALITSHQLSPVFALLTVVAIGAARGCIRWRLLAFMLVAEASGRRWRRAATRRWARAAPAPACARVATTSATGAPTSLARTRRPGWCRWWNPRPASPRSTRSWTRPGCAACCWARSTCRSRWGSRAITATPTCRPPCARWRCGRRRAGSR